MQLDKKQIISVKEARKLMGKASANFDDVQIKDIINELQFLADITSKAAYEQLSKEMVPKSP